MNVLITGGAGFIGTHLAKRLVESGHAVTILDNFNPQVHFGGFKMPADLGSSVNLVVADVRSKQEVKAALAGQHAVVHLAAETGTGQSMYEIEKYCAVNIGGTATLLEAIRESRPCTLKKIVVASSRAVYGEGAYQCTEHGPVYPLVRETEKLRQGQFEPVCPQCSLQIGVMPTPEDARLQPTSFYGLTKQVQEQMVLLFGKTWMIDSIALRYQNVFGPGQSLSNPYTGILAIFAGQLRHDKPVLIFEDGKESRDMVFVDDVIDATISALHAHFSGPINVGSGTQTTVLQIAEEMARFFDSKSTIKVTGAFREGDIRHSIADLTRAKRVLGFVPKTTFRDGLKSFLQWASASSAISAYERSLEELREKGLLHGR